MVKINPNFQKLPGNYLFSEIARRVSAHAAANPGKKLIRLGIGDCTLPLPPAVIKAMSAAVEEMGKKESFRGYGPEQGYEFLREAIAENDYAALGIKLAADEIFVSDGAKSDCGNIGDIFDKDNSVAVCDPVYPAYVDTNAMAGRAGDHDGDRWTNLIYMPCTAETGFMPEPPKRTPDMIYLCFPNNPTGAAATRDRLSLWVDYAVKNGSVILFDGAYEAFITDETLPRSIYEIKGAEECAIEFRSFSKTAGFTGTRCAYTVVPKALKRQGESLNSMWNRRQTTKFNGVPYIVQRGAAAIYSDEGKKEVAANLAYYQKNAAVIREGLTKASLSVFGGVNSPYIWAQTPGKASSWDFFDLLLNKAGVVSTPGAGFGPAGEGYIRLTAFGDAEATIEAVERIADSIR
ncbi:MAG: LL-diaminopimelate aminotransferase [Oscillospiraceae bacterium]|nr:LL-diaminopimelate aminotransferase [Oscillospiraceae bacterium]